MAQKLGEITKPKVTDYTEKRKLFCLPLIPEIKGMELPENLKKGFEKFWNQAIPQLEDLERTAKISYIFFESITQDDKQGLEMIKNINKQSHKLVKEKIKEGAKLISIENPETFNEFLDWSICLSMIGRSPKVFNKVLEFYNSTAKLRLEEMAKKIDKTLEKNESALLIMTDENRMQLQSNLPQNIQVFLIHPPAFNDIQKMLRDFSQNIKK
jgi:guanylate kinase